MVNSTQQAIDLAARVLLSPGDDAFVEEPGYAGARAALLAAGLHDQAIAHAVEGGGLGVSALSRYYAGPGEQPGLLLSYGAATSAAIARGIDALTPWLVSGRSIDELTLATKRR